MAGADLECRGPCEGEVRASTKAECEATVEAKAKVSIACVPPELTLTWQWSDTFAGDAAAQANFRAWIGVLRGHLAALLATDAKATVLAELTASLVTATEGEVKNSIEGIQEHGDLKARILAGCALTQVADAVALLEDTAARLDDTLGASAQVLIGVGG
jgi:hypothetical protein